MNHRNRFPARRRFLKQSAALSAGASLAAPAAVLAQVQGPALKLGLLHAVSGPDAAVGRACREAALLALQEINQRRKVHGLAPLLSVCADAALHTQPLTAVAAMQSQGVDVVLALISAPLPGPLSAPLSPVPPSRSAVADASCVTTTPLDAMAVLRLTPAALTSEASAACVALLRPLPAAEQLAVASSYVAVLALDAVLDDAAAPDLAVAMREAGLAVLVAAPAVEATAATMATTAPATRASVAGAQCVLLVPVAAPLARSRRA